MDEPVWVPTDFAKNRDRLPTQAIARSFVRRVVERAAGLLSDEHFTVDGKLIEAWASQKSFQPKDRPLDGDGRNFHGHARTNNTHASATDPGAKLYRRSDHGEARLSHLDHLLIDNRHGLIVDATATTAHGYAERDAAATMVYARARRQPLRRRTVGADKGYDTADFVEVLRALRTTPHVTQNVKRHGGSAIDGRTTRHPGYGWPKTIGGLRKIKTARLTEGHLADLVRQRHVQPPPAPEADARRDHMRPRVADRRVIAHWSDGSAGPQHRVAGTWQALSTSITRRS
jgi:hypothetical protein